jgi:CheY-like chemotaxis protein
MTREELEEQDLRFAEDLGRMEAARRAFQRCLQAGEGGRTLLVADPNLRVRLYLAATFRAAGYEVRQSDEGTNALAQIWQYRPCVALLDADLPGLTGLEVCSVVRTSSDLAMTRVVLLASRPSPHLVERAPALGAEALVTKPFSPIYVLELVERLCRDDPQSCAA